MPSPAPRDSWLPRCRWSGGISVALRALPEAIDLIADADADVDADDDELELCSASFRSPLELLKSCHSSSLYHCPGWPGCIDSIGRPVINELIFRASRKGLFLHCLLIVPSRSTQLLNFPPVPNTSGVVVQSMDKKVVESARRVRMKMVMLVADLFWVLGASNGLVSPLLAMS